MRPSLLVMLSFCALPSCTALFSFDDFSFQRGSGSVGPCSEDEAFLREYRIATLRIRSLPSTAAAPHVVRLNVALGP